MQHKPGRAAVGKRRLIREGRRLQARLTRPEDDLAKGRAEHRLRRVA